MPGKNKGRAPARELPPSSEAAPSPTAGAPSSDVIALRRSTRSTRSGSHVRPEPEGDSEKDVDAVSDDDDEEDSDEVDEDGFRRRKPKPSRKRRREAPSKARSARDDKAGDDDDEKQHKRGSPRAPAVVYIPREGNARQPLTAEHEDAIIGALKRGDWTSE